MSLPEGSILEDERGTVGLHYLRVRYAETDQMGVAYHGAYVPWIEEGRTEWIRLRGRSYASLEAEGMLLAVTDLQLRFRRSARYDELIRIETWLAAKGPASITLDYRLFRHAPGEGGDGELLAEASTRLGLLGRDMRPRRMPKGLF
jgi:acyl-CoA thioester hydrolase